MKRMKPGLHTDRNMLSQYANIYIYNVTKITVVLPEENLAFSTELHREAKRDVNTGENVLMTQCTLMYYILNHVACSAYEGEERHVQGFGGET